MSEQHGQADDKQAGREDSGGVDLAEATTATAGAVGGAYQTSQFGPLFTALGAAIGGISAASVASDRETGGRTPDGDPPT